MKPGSGTRDPKVRLLPAGRFWLLAERLRSERVAKSPSESAWE